MKFSDFKKEAKSWLSRPESLILLAILIFALGIRFYYYPLTSSQGLWWDESEYLSTAYTWSGLYNWWQPLALRPPLLPWIMTLLTYFGVGESGTRILVFIMSFASIYFTYLVGKTFYTKEVGLASASLLAIFWSFLFYSFRILT
ncbi:MAG: glycosyltransferase family 39 protein, partial [Nanoarchaeota archaeon]|nr:glycosyltransferase family 39 protein [Nanoarchaeota archaeon]